MLAYTFKDCVRLHVMPDLLTRLVLCCHPRANILQQNNVALCQEAHLAFQAELYAAHAVQQFRLQMRMASPMAYSNGPACSGRTSSASRRTSSITG